MNIRKFLFGIFFCTSFLFLKSQTIDQQTFYIAAKNGVILRERPDINATALAKIAYGEKIFGNYEDGIDTIFFIEGFQTRWFKINYKGKQGYIADAFLFNHPPPKAGTKNLNSYLPQLSTLAGSMKTDRNSPTINRPFGVRKQLYKNGAEHHEYEGYEYGSEVFIIPDFNVYQAFQLLRLLPEYVSYIKATDAFPQQSNATNTNDTEKRIMLTEQSFGDNEKFAERLKIELSEGYSGFIDIYPIENQIVIHYGSGI